MHWKTTVLAFFAAAQTLAAVPCPDGAYPVGAMPPDGTEQGCELREKSGKVVRHGPWIEWYLNGQKQKEGQYYNGYRRGQWTWWYPSGQKMQQGSFNDGRPVGTWSYWDENGRPQSAGKEQPSPSSPGLNQPQLNDFANSLQKSFKNKK